MLGSISCRNNRRRLGGSRSLIRALQAVRLINKRRTPDAPYMEVLMATMLANIDEKFEALRREQSAPTTAGPSSQPDEQPDESRLTQHVSRHRAGRSSPSLDRVVNSSDSECTGSDFPAVEIEMRTHRKVKRHGSTSTTGSTVIQLGDDAQGTFPCALCAHIMVLSPRRILLPHIRRPL